MVFWGVLQEFPELQRVFTDLLHRREQEACDGDVDHLLQEATGLEEVLVFAHLHETMQLRTGCRVRVAVV